MDSREIKQKHLDRLNMFSKLADRICIKMAIYGATKTMILLCFIIASLPFIFPTLLNFCQYLSSGYIQLVYLPIILYYGKMTDRVNEARQQELILIIKDMHEETHEELKILKLMNLVELQK